MFQRNTLDSKNQVLKDFKAAIINVRIILIIQMAKCNVKGITRIDKPQRIQLVSAAPVMSMEGCSIFQVLVSILWAWTSLFWFTLSALITKWCSSKVTKKQRFLPNPGTSRQRFRHTNWTFTEGSVGITHHQNNRRNLKTPANAHETVYSALCSLLSLDCILLSLRGNDLCCTSFPSLRVIYVTSG